METGFNLERATHLSKGGWKISWRTPLVNIQHWPN